MAAIRNWLSVRLILATALAIVMIVSSMVASQQGLRGSDGILFEFEGGGITREPATETAVQIGITHTCVFNDELILEKVEIYGESEIPVKSFAVNETLDSVFWRMKLLEALVKLWLYPLAGKLAEQIRAKSFSTGYFTIDLRQLKQSLSYGEIPIMAKATLIHNGERVTLERELIAEYQGKLPGG